MSVPLLEERETRRRWLRHLAIACFYMVVATGLLAPMASNDILPWAPDHANHVAMIIQARLAADEGQFPIRVAPWEHHRYRYPTYQFYGPLAYTAGQAIYRWVTPRNPFTAYKLTEWSALVLAGFFTYLSAWFLTRDRGAALLGGLVFMSAPYVLINVHARGAFTEVVAQGLLAGLFYVSLRAYAGSWRAPWMGLAGLGWAGLALSHNITYLCAGTFFGLLFVMISVRRRGVDAGLWRVGVGFALGVLLAMYFLAPILSAFYLSIHDAFGTVYEFYWLTPLAGLLSPVSLPPEIAPGIRPTTTHLNPAVGWPTIAGVGWLLAVFHTLPRTSDHGPAPRRMAVALIVMFALAFFLAWSPIDIWSHLPQSALVVQFTYRLLTFVAFPGALLTAYAIAYGQPDRVDARQVAFAILLILTAHSSYLPRQEQGRETILGLLTKPRVGYGDGAYLMRQSTALPDGVPEWRRDLPLFDRQGRLTPGATAELSRDELRAISDLHLEVEVATAPGGGTVVLFIDDREQLRLPFTEHVSVAIEPFRDIVAAAPGPVIRLRLAFEPAASAPAPTAAPAATADAIRDARVTRVALAGFAVRNAAVLPVRETPRVCGPERDGIVCRVTAAGPLLVQVPTLFYPDMLDVRVDGRPAPAFLFRTLGYGLTGVALDAGTHEIRVRFRGLAWANLISVLTAVITLAGVGLSLWAARRG